MKQIFLLLALFLVVAACSKQNEPEITPTLRTTLTSPGNNATIASTGQTQFAWSVDASNTTVPVTHNIKIVEIVGDQSPENAFRTNKPIFEKDSLLVKSPVINYPLSAMSPGFTPDKKYAWQVTARQNGLITTGGVSEIFVFTASPHLTTTLTSPLNNATVVTTRQTQFTWSVVASNAKVPVTNKITIVEVMSGQTGDVALRTNKPIFEKDSCCNFTTLTYPITAMSPGFTADKKYAWQVLSRQNGLTSTGGTSGVFVFTGTR